jgi:hypothetical protein
MLPAQAHVQPDTRHLKPLLIKLQDIRSRRNPEIEKIRVCLLKLQI